MRTPGDPHTKVLIVDDEAGYCRKLGRYFSAHGYDVVTATSGEEAVSIGSRTHPELLITDWMLRGDIHGLDVIDALQAVNPNTRTVLMTGFASADLREEAALRDVSAFVEKPFSPEQLGCAVEHAMRADAPTRPSRGVALITTNRDGTIVHVNHAAAALLGKTPAEGTRFSDLFPPGLAPCPSEAAGGWLEVLLSSADDPVPCRLRTRSYGDEGWMAVLCRNEEAAALAYDPSVKLLLDDTNNAPIRWKLDGHGLVIDTDASTRSLVSNVFYELGSICHTSDSFDSALSIYKKDPEIRYVVVDCTAGKDIATFVARIRSIRPDCTLVGQCERPYKNEFACAGIETIIRKPWTVDDFMSLLARHD